MRAEKERFVRSLRSRFFLRFHMTLILLAAFAAGLIATKILLELGANVLWQRYLIAVSAAYLVFLAAIKLWLVYVRQQMEEESEELSATDVADTAGEVAIEGVDWSLDWDLEGAAIMVLLVLLLFIFAGGLYVIWAAPAILAEAAFEALLASALVRRARQLDTPGWVGGVVRRTLAPFLCVLLVSVYVGWAAQERCPQAMRVVDAILCE